jgi:hypothetical protein
MRTTSRLPNLINKYILQYSTFREKLYNINEKNIEVEHETLFFAYFLNAINNVKNKTHIMGKGYKLRLHVWCFIGLLLVT